MKSAKTLQDITNGLWTRYCEALPRLVKFDTPTIKINNRIYKTAGRCMVYENVIEMSGKLLDQHYDAMILEILPHEICHQIDYNLNPNVWSMRNAHSKRWVDIGIKLDIELHTYHTLEYTK